MAIGGGGDEYAKVRYALLLVRFFLLSPASEAPNGPGNLIDSSSVVKPINCGLDKSVKDY